ncbi:MAG: M50 family metallopeptidase [Rubripirellula sp.]
MNASKSDQENGEPANEPPPGWTLALWSAWAWLVMTITHELGHVVAALTGGAKLVALELRPWHLPHSLYVADPHPLITLWGGPAVGCLVPLAVAVAMRRPATWYVAWFCVVANAIYLLLGYYSGDAELDSTKMLQAGNSKIVLLAVAGVACTIGYVQFRKCCMGLINGSTRRGTRRDHWISAAALLIVITMQATVGSL